MFAFILKQIHVLVDATSVIAGISQRAEMKFSKQLFSMGITISPPSPNYCTISLQMFPQFFHEYVCLNTQYYWIFIDDFYSLMFDSQRSGYPSLTFSLPKFRRADLTFIDSYGRFKQHHQLRLLPSVGVRDLGEFDCAAFVSMDTKQFENIVLTLNKFDFVYVTLSHSEVKLFSSEGLGITLTTEARECIIGGIAPSVELQMIISLKPLAPLYSMGRRAERVWLFKSTNSSKAVIVAPIGLHIRFLASLL